MLAAQMGIVHMILVRFAGHFPVVETIQQQDGAERALNKLARTYAMQMEASSVIGPEASRKSRCSTYR